MTQNIFAIEDQEALSNLIHHPNTNCPGDCPTCSKFHKATKFAHTAAMEMNIVLTLTENEKPVDTYGYFQVWCAECSDGENNTFWECCDWAERHATRRHNIRK